MASPAQDSAQRVGIDLGGTKIEGVTMTPDGTLTARYRVSTPPPSLAEDARYNAILAEIETLVGRLRDGPQAPVGIGIPGVVSPKTGLVKNANTTCLNGRPFLQDLQHRLGPKIRMANDANCFALSEAVDGAAKPKTAPKYLRARWRRCPGWSLGSSWAQAPGVGSWSTVAS